MNVSPVLIRNRKEVEGQWYIILFLSTEQSENNNTVTHRTVIKITQRNYVKDSKTSSLLNGCMEFM